MGKILDNFEIEFTENYYSNDWSINLIDLRKEVSEIYWHTPEHVINTNCFSLDDFYFATI